MGIKTDNGKEPKILIHYLINKFPLHNTILSLILFDPS